MRQLNAAELVRQGLVHHRAGELARAEALYKQALSIDPKCADAYHFLGTLAHQVDQDELAIQLLTTALALKPSPRTLNNLGEAYRALDRLDDALKCFATAIQMMPNYAEAHQNLGVVLGQQMKLDAALAEYDKAIELQPENAEAHTNRALVWLAQGDFERGFAEYEWRQKRPEYHRPFKEPQWDGKRLDGKTLLIWAEQGFGDTLQFARFIPQTLQMGGNVIFEVQPELRRLFEDSFDVTLVSQGQALPRFDVQCPLMSLAGLFGTTVATIPATVPYVRASADGIERWRERLKGITGKRVGVAWATNRRSPTARRRSCRLSDLAPLCENPDVQLISLQKGDAEADLAHAQGMRIFSFSNELTDLAETAALIANLDAVVTVDTAVAHLAGAMGKRVSVLLPFASDWRWLLNRKDSPWYATAKLYRQTTAGDWGPVIRLVVQDWA